MVTTPARRALAERLRRPRYEVLPLDGVEDQVHAHLGTGVKLTVTASPRKGLEPTLALSERLAAAGYVVVPHVSARLVRDQEHLREVLERMRAAGVRELFVPAGDASEPAGEFDGAAALLAAMGPLRASFPEIGITGYPESHHLISDVATIDAMAEKATMATYIVSQICFDTDVIAGWVGKVRARGITLPIWIGVPGRIEYAKLARISLRIGLGDSVRFLGRHRNVMGRLMTRRFSPDALVRGLGPLAADPAADVAGFHFYTFNEVARTERWRLSTLAQLEGSAEANSAAASSSHAAR